MKRLFKVCMVLPLFEALLFGQGVTSLAGTVTDPSQAVIVGASLELENVETRARRSTLSDSAGRYSFPQILPGKYTITARAPGFSTTTIHDLHLLVNTPANVNIRLELGIVPQSVSVRAEVTQVNAFDATLGNAFGARPIVQLPFEGRNVIGLLTLQPGVTFVGDASPALREDYRNGAVNGGKSDQANVTLDGVDVNDQQDRLAFTSVLRVTLDSIQEFRVTTSNPNADQGRSSGAQVALVTRSGTNELHGALYEYHRNTVTSANTFFNNAATPKVERPKLIRNTFGAAVGGPAVKNRLFYFLNYEGRRDAREGSAVRVVPSETLRLGILRYTTTAGTVAALSPEDVKRRVDPLGMGPNPAVLQLLQSYPHPNDASIGDNLNSLGFRFKAPIRLRQNTYIAKFDSVLDGGGRRLLFVRGNLQNDHENDLPQFPGAPPNSVRLNNSKGLAVGYTAVFRADLVGNTRYGFTRQGDEQTGIQTGSAVFFRGLDDRYGLTRGLSRVLPVQNFSQDFAWTKGPHSVQFGGNLRWIRNSRVNFDSSFHFAQADAAWLAGLGGDLHTSLTDLEPRSRTSFRSAAVTLLGILSQGRAFYNYDLRGNAQAIGAPVRRKFAAEEYEMYVQDTWRISRGLTVTAGVRYSLMPPVYEANGVQISTNQRLGEWFNRRGAVAEEGRPQFEAGRITYVLASTAQGRSLYEYHKKNLGPRFAVAYSPPSAGGWRRRLIGGPGRTSIRAGWGMHYDLFGQGLMRMFDAEAFGLSTRLLNPSNTLTSSTAPRFTGLYGIPAELIRSAPKGGFPQDQPDNFAIAAGIDDTLKPPYSMSMNLTVGREFDHGFYVQGSYVGRLSRRALAQRDLAMPTNLKDPSSGMTYFEAAQQLARLVNAGTPVTEVPRIAFWENLWPDAARGGLTASQTAFNAFKAAAPDYTSALRNLDVLCRPACSKFGPYALFNAQFSALTAWSSIAGGNYHAMQWTVRKRFNAGFQFDLNYTWSKSIDMASHAERASRFKGFILNSWFPGQRKGVSDYDMTHQWNSNWVAELPVGRDRKYLSGIGKGFDALIGGWQISGLWRQTSGLPRSVLNGLFWPTNWQEAGYATQTGIAPRPATSRNAPAAVAGGRPGPNIFADPKAALDAYSHTLPGESGQRNGIRGDGYFGIDLGLAKRFRMPFNESHSLQFRWEIFNLTNSVRFDVNASSASLGSAATFGKYNDILTPPRVMQFGLRYEF